MDYSKLSTEALRMLFAATYAVSKSKTDATSVAHGNEGDMNHDFPLYCAIIE